MNHDTGWVIRSVEQGGKSSLTLDKIMAAVQRIERARLDKQPKI